MGNLELQGVFGIVPTPLNRDASLDEPGLRHLIQHCRESGLHAAVVLGSNGEYPYFNFAEKERIIAVAGQAAEGFPLVAGVSAYGTDEAVALTRQARACGCAAVLAALPLYYRLDLAAVQDHYRALVREGGLPVLFYYWPEVTGQDLSPDEIAQIAEIEGVVGAKLSVLNRSFLKRVIQLTRTQLWRVFTGTTFLLHYALRRGAAGVLCPLPLIAPHETMTLYRLMAAGEFEQADKIQDHLLGALPLFTGVDQDRSLAAALFKALANKPYTGPGERPAGSMALVKEALRLQGHPIAATVRRPCPPLTPQQAELVAKTLKSQGWL
jgi:dihydrodipicolinate synthase/N-acetylneuraminate lyase